MVAIRGPNECGWDMVTEEVQIWRTRSGQSERGAQRGFCEEKSVKGTSER
jgi:hypothetical protein